MYLGILGEYGKILLEFSPYVLKLSAYLPKKFYYFPCIQRRFCVLTSSYSSCSLRYFPHILRICSKNGKYAERNFYCQQCLIQLKGPYFEKIKMVDHKLQNYKEQITNFIFWLESSLCVYGEYAK